MIARNAYAERARQKKVNSVAYLIDTKATESGLNPHVAEVAANIVEQLVSAPAEKRRGLAQEAHQNPLSDDSWNDLVNVYRQRAGLPLSTVAAPAPVPARRCPGCGGSNDRRDRDLCRPCEAKDDAKTVEEIAEAMGEQRGLRLVEGERSATRTERFIDGPGGK